MINDEDFLCDTNKENMLVHGSDVEFVDSKHIFLYTIYWFSILGDKYWNFYMKRLMYLEIHFTKPNHGFNVFN